MPPTVNRHLPAVPSRLENLLTAIFTLPDQVLLRLLPVKNPQQLVLLTVRGRHYGSNWGGNAISYPPRPYRRSPL